MAKRNYLMIIAIVTCMIVLAGCKKTAQEPAVSEPPEDIPYEDEFAEEEYYDEEYPYEEYYDEEYPDEEIYGEEVPEEGATSEGKDNTMAVGVWYTDGYDEENNWNSSYKIELTADGNASCTGWRNKDTGSFKVTGDNKVLITFDKCETDSPGKGFVPVDDFKYTIEMTIKGDDAQIKIDAPDVISNLVDGTVHRKSDGAKAEEAEEGDEGEGTDIADGEYITDEKYKGDISSDGATLSIETALSHYDKDWNTVLDYEKRTYVFSTSKDCKCVIYTEDKEEYPIAKQVDLINDFLKGNSGLPITLKIRNNELVEISFSS